MPPAVCIVTTDQTLRRTYARPVVDDDEVEMVLADVTRNVWLPVAAEARTELVTNRQILPADIYADGPLSIEQPAQHRFGRMDWTASVLYEGGVVGALVQLAWKLAHGDELDDDDKLLLGRVDGAVVFAGEGEPEGDCTCHADIPVDADGRLVHGADCPLYGLES